MASNDDIPQWKKDLILRKRSQNKCPSTTVNKQNSEQLLCTTVAVGSDADSDPTTTECVTSKQASQTRSTFPVSTEHDGDIHVIEKCDTKSVVNETNVNFSINVMVQDSVLIVNNSVKTPTMVAEKVTNGDHIKSDAESDSSEELQYGPGIVSKLKSKYLSLTLREKKVAKPRQTILNMRRATSLENMLDADSGDELMEPNLNQKNAKPVPTQSRKFTPRTENTSNGNTRNVSTRYRTAGRTNDSMKRARSVETLHSTDINNRELINEDVVIIEKEGNDNHRKRQDNKITVQTAESKSFTCNGGQIINRPKRITSFMDDTERPPADHVKHTMMLFEGPPLRRTKGPRPTGEVAAKVANFKNIIEKEKNNKKNVVKPQITPKPVGHNKTRKVYRPVSPKKLIDCSLNETVSPIDKVRPISPLDKMRPLSPSDKVGPLSPLEKLRPVSPLNIVGPLSPSEKIRPVSPLNKVGHLSPEKVRPISPLSKVGPLSPIEKVRPLSPFNKTGPLSPTDKIRPPSPSDKNWPVSPVNKTSPEIRLPSSVSVTPDVTPNPSQIPDVSRISEVCEKTGPDSEPVRSRIMSETPDLILHSSLLPSNFPSPNAVKKLTESFISAEKKHSESNVTTTSPTTKAKINGAKHLNSRSPSPSPHLSSSAGLIRTPSSSSPVEDNCDGISTKTINKEAVDNISQASHSITFAISDNISKSHLPRLSTVSVGINRLVPDTPSSKPIPKPLPKPTEDVKKKCEAVNELVSQSPKSVLSSHASKDPTNRPPVSNTTFTNNISKPKQKDVIKNNVDIVSKPVNRPPTPVQNKNLTNREITKNFINSAKTFEQPVSKVVVSVRSVEDVVVNNSAPSFLGKSISKPNRNQEQTSLLFNFQDRDTVPDYIAHDNSVPQKRGKREKPKVINILLSIFKYIFH